MGDELEPHVDIYSLSEPLRLESPASPDECCHIVRTVARMMDVPIVMVIAIKDGRKSLISQFGFNDQALPACTAFGDHTFAIRQTLVVPDAREDPRFANCALVAEGVGLRFYAGTPLFDNQGTAIGTLCTMDTRPRAALSKQQEAILEDMARLVVDRLELQRREHEVQIAKQRDAMRHKLLCLVLEAPDFDAACKAAMEYLRRITGAQFCRLFRLAEDGERVAFVGGMNAPDIDPAAVAEELRSRSLNIHNTLTGQAMASGQQIIMPDLSVDQDIFPLHAWITTQGTHAYIATPLSVLDESHALGLGFSSTVIDQGNFAELAAIARDAADTLRPMLRRLKDEATARLFRRAVECSPDPVMITEAEPHNEPGPRIVYCNQAFCDLTGHRMDQVIGRSPRFLQGPNTEPEAREALRVALATKQSVRQVITNYKADGTPYQVELNLAPVVDNTGYFTHWVSVQRDVTPQHTHEMEREAMLRELQALFGAIPGAILRYRRVSDGIWERCFVTSSIETLTGCSVDDAMQPGWVHDHMRSEDFDVLQAHLQLASDNGTAAAEFRFRHRSGDLRLFQAKMCSYLGANGDTEVITIWTDITRERRMSAQLDQASKLADLGELAAGLAHELNRPLAAIMLAADNAVRALKRGPDALPRIAEKLDTITNLAQHGADVVRHVQLFGRIDGGEPVPVALTALLSDMMILAQAKFMECNVSVEKTIPADLPKVFARPIPLEQVLINLISNACDAYEAAVPKIGPTERKIWIDARCENDRVIIDVRDRAGGVPDKHLPYLFDAFFTTKPLGKGTGLGLSISSGIVREMGGKLSVFNKEGGANFVLDLPASME